MSASHEIYSANADLIERALALVCRRHSLYGADAEDFSSTARLHIIENDYAVLRRFEERSSLSTYLVVVITRQFQDWRNSRWGKWRPSAEAKRLGDVAVRLETLTVRDGLSMDEAQEILRSRHDVTASRSALEAMAARFPIRFKRSFEDETTLAILPSPQESAEEQVIAHEEESVARRASQAVGAAIRALPAQDRLILKMRFEDNCQIACVAEALKLESKPLYRRIDRLLLSLRQALEAQGFSAPDLVAAWSRRGFDMLEQPETRGEVRPFKGSGHSPALTGGHHD